jgi:hypothetical protein
MAFDDYTFLSKFICRNPIKGVLLELNSVISNRKAATKIILQADFPEKLHLETGLAFNTTRYSLQIFCSSGNNSDLIPLGSMVTASGTPIDLLKQDDLCVH